MTTITVTPEQCVLKWDAVVGESPLWHAEEQRLYWVDIQHRRVHRLDPVTGRNETRKTPDLVSCLAFCRDGRLLITLRKRIAFLHFATGRIEPVADVEEGQETRFNDGRVDPQGRFWCGTTGDPGWDEPIASLYRLNADRSLDTVLTGIKCSNGTAWSPDGRTMYYTESFRHTVWAFDFDAATGGLSGKRPFATLDPAGKVFPDGLCVDAEGFVWSNHVGVGKVVRYDPTGRVERELVFPVPRAVGCAFGGEAMTTLFVTTARETMSQEELAAAPLSGGVFGVDLGIRGLPATLYGG